MPAVVFSVVTPSMKAIRALWLTVSVVVLAVSCYITDSRPTDDADEFLIWSMIFISAPTGLLVPLVYGSIAYVLYSAFSAVIAPAGAWYYIHLVLLWLAFVALGYFQWFTAAPRFARWIRGVIASWRESRKRDPGK
jgi:hypothetical protein